MDRSAARGRISPGTCGASRWIGAGALRHDPLTAEPRHVRRGTATVTRSSRGDGGKRLGVVGSNGTENETGQQRTNPGQQYELGPLRRLYMKDEATRLTVSSGGGYLGYRYDLDGASTIAPSDDGRGRRRRTVGVRPQWEAFGTAMAGAQQEEGEGGSPTYPWRPASTGRSVPRGGSPSADSSPIRAPRGGERGIAAKAGTYGSV